VFVVVENKEEDKSSSSDAAAFMAEPISPKRFAALPKLLWRLPAAALRVVGVLWYDEDAAAAAALPR
jgi:hypothetical protein